MSVQKFLDFVNQTGSPYHSVEACKKILREAGYVQLREIDTWKLARGGRYFTTKNNSAIFAFTVGKNFSRETGGFCIFGTHTDSPCLRIRPNSNMQNGGHIQLGVETYGGGLWHTWFDRGLGFAGKVVYKNGDSLREALVRVNRPVCIIPNLAVHLTAADDRGAFKINNEIQLRPVLGTSKGLAVGDADLNNRLTKPILDLICKEIGIESDESIVDVDVCLFDVNPSGLCGIDNEFIESARIDNLASTFAGIQALVNVGSEANENDIAIACAFDHEECGSQSWCGADSSCLRDWLERVHRDIAITGGTPTTHVNDEFQRALRRSILFSADMAHGHHPNYLEKHQAQHRPMLNAGLVIKSNGNQRYATHALTASFVRSLAAKATPPVPVQDFVVRNDSPCGTTIGPIISSTLGIRAVDIGCPQWAMHSIREICGAKDMEVYVHFAESCFRNFRSIDAQCRYLDDMIEEPY